MVVLTTDLWLLGFALSKAVAIAGALYSERALRLVVGPAIVIFAVEMKSLLLFRIFGWVVAIKTLGLQFIPWRWRNQLGKRSIPPAIRQIKLYAFGAYAQYLVV